MDPEEAICECTEPGWCPHYAMNVLGHAWDVSRMDNNLGKRTRKIWRRKAKIQSTKPVQPAKPCNCGGQKS